MNRFTRLTALLLALMMILSTFAAAETAYQVGDMTTEQWNSIVQNAQSILNEPVINKGGDVIDYPPETPTPSTPYDKTIEVTLGQNQDITTANLAVVKSNVADQWQIAIKDDLWVNILGEDGNTLNVNAAMLQGTALKVRQAGNDAQVTAFTVFEETAATMQSETTKFSVEPREGTTADTPMTVEDANPDIEKFALQIVYRTATTHVEVASPYTASFVNGSSYSATVRYPVVKGYTPQLSTSAIEGVTLTDNGDSLTYSFTKLTPNAPIEIVVLYNPAQVTYDVNHYQQNADDDDYKLVATETLTGYTEAETEAAAKQYDGFYALLFDQPTIAADGSTDVNIYYDRHYYLMNFELSGGYGVEPIYARYEATIPPVGTPTRAGYSFVGWNDEDGNRVSSIPTTMPAKNRTFTAVWNAGTTTFNVVFWYENANDDGYSVAGSYGPITATAGTTVTSGAYANQNFTGRDDEHFTYNAAMAESKVVAGDGSTILNVYYTRNLYVVDFVATGLCGIENHAHSAECQGLICKLPAHTHGEACAKELVCSLDEHTHTAGCMVCSEEEHNHTQACCSLTEHTHQAACCNNNDIGHRFITHGIGALLGAEFVDWLGCTAGCGKEEHTHGDGGCNTNGCGKENHVHTEACYKDIEHTHTDGCYVYTCNQQEHTHTSTCYATCAIPEHTCSGNCFDENSTNVVKRIVAKYDSDISSAWETDPVKGYLDDGYVFKSSLTSKYYSYLEKMPGSNITMTATQWDGNTYVWYYYLEKLDGQEAQDTDRNNIDGKDYYLYHTTSVNGNSISLTYEEDYFPITGFTQRDTTVPSFQNRVAYLYYVRNQYELKFMNYGNEVMDKTEMVYYQADISDRNFTPAYPSTLQAGVYQFGGWYTTEQCYDGSEFVFEGATMPAGPVILYAKWEPVDKTVTFYLDLPTLETNGAALGSVTVPYGTKVAEENIPAHEKTGYKFVGWFYVENGEEKAFDFANMPVTKDMEVYGKWTSDTMVPYRVRYVYVENGVETPVAADETGSAPGGSTETFDAKVGAELYDNYQKGYFPTLTKSHNVLMDVVKDANGVVQEVVYTFYYYKRDAVPYIVYYVDSAGKELLAPYVNTGNVESIVSETFKPITGYMPDEFQKSLVVNGDNDTSVQWITVDVNGVSVQVHPDNVITFVYSKNETEALYVMSYYMEELDGSYTLYARENAQVGTVDQEYSNKPLETVPEGFSYEKTVVVTSAGELVNETTEQQISAVLTTDGLEFKHYYKRNLYPYTVHYYKQGTTESVYASKTVSDNKYGQKVPETARDLTPAYSLVSLPEASITIGTGENVIIFEYAENDVLIQYEAVGLTEEQKASALTSTGETLPAVSGNAEGSIAKEILGYTFDGWYTDEACENAVGAADGIVADVTDPTVGTKFAPLKEAATEQLPDGYYSDAVFYAKYTENTATITYKAVCKVGDNEYTEADTGGTVDVPNNATPAGAEDRETVTVVTGTVAGATAEPTRNYEFLGWFTKDDNGKYVAIENGSEPEYLPVKGDIWQDATYYALFELDVADLTITKKVNNAKDGTVAPTGDVFTFRVELPDGEYTYTVDGKESGSKLDVQDGKGELSIKAGEVVAIKDVVINSHYKVSEVKKHDYFEASNSVEDQIAATGSAVEITNTYLTGNLAIIKNVTSDKAPDDTFTMNVTLKLPDTTGAKLPTSFSVSYSNPTATDSIISNSGTISLKAGQSATIVGLPYGTTYEVTEVTPPEYYNAVAEYKFSDPKKKIDSEANDIVEVTNTYNTGTLEITKTVVGNAPADEFAITVTLTLPNGMTDLPGSVQYVTTAGKYTVSGGTVTYTVGATGGTLAISGLPVGTKYNVTEAAPPSYYTSDIRFADETKAITNASEVYEVTVTNTYNTGSLTVEKSVTSDPAVATLPQDTFTIDVELELPKDNGAKVSLDHIAESITKPDSVVLTPTNGGFRFTNVVAGTQIVFNNLPHGTGYTIAEVTPPEYFEVKYNDAVSDSVGGTIDAKTVDSSTKDVTVDITNTYLTGDLEITKVVDGTGMPADDSFNIDVAFKLPEGNATIPITYTLSEGVSASDQSTTTVDGVKCVTVQFTGVQRTDRIVITGIPYDTTYSVTETSKPGYYSDQVIYTYSDNTDKRIDSAKETVEVKNTYLTGSLTITKKVEKPFDSDLTDVYPRQFQFTLALTDDADAAVNATITATGDMLQTGNTCTFSLQNNGSITLSGIPHGVTCTVTENDTAGEKKVSDYFTTTVNGVAGYSTEVEMDVESTQPATVAFVNTAKTSKLTVEKTGMSDGESAIVNVSVGDETYTVVLKGSSATAVITNLPIGANYSATETDWSWRYTKNGIDYSDTAQKINKEGTSKITVKNSSTGDKWLHDEDSKKNTFGTN